MNRTEDVFLSHEHLWSYRTRTVDPNSLTIRSVTHNGILRHSTAETLCEEAARISTKELVELKNANHCPFTFNEYLSYYFYKIYLAYNCSENAIIKNRWIIRNIIDPNITTDPLLHNVDAKYLKDLINACKAYCEGTEYAVAKLLQLFSDDIWKHGEVSCNPAPSPAAYKKPQTTVLLYTSEQLKIFLNAVYSSSCPTVWNSFLPCSAACIQERYLALPIKTSLPVPVCWKSITSISKTSSHPQMLPATFISSWIWKGSGIFKSLILLVKNSSAASRKKS